MDALNELYLENHREIFIDDSLMKAVLNDNENCEDCGEKEVKECLLELGKTKEVQQRIFDELELNKANTPQKIELKQLPTHLKYVFLEENGEKPVIISNHLSKEEQQKLIKVLMANKEAIGWTFVDLKGISPAYCMHKIHMEQDFKPVAQPPRLLNPSMKEVVRKEVQKLLEAGMIYPISDSVWVSLVQVVPIKGGMTIIYNEKN